MTRADDVFFKRDIKRAIASLDRVQRKVVPGAVVKALNKTATSQRNVGLKEVAKKLRLPQKNVTARFDKNGKKKADRATIQKASRSRMYSAIEIYNRGIPLIQIITRANLVKAAINVPSKAAIKAGKIGIKAKGGRFYKRVFIAETSGGNVQILTRKGKSRSPVGVPKIGVRNHIIREYNKALRRSGVKVFGKRLKEEIRFALQKQKK